MPDSFLFLNDPRYWAVAGAAALAGLVRGFSGFGGAMVFMPVASLVYEPELAAVLLFIADDLAALAMLPDALRRCVWREVLPLGIAAVIAVPFGVALLVVADADVMRWVICSVILLAVGLMALGWRYTARLGLPATLGTGLLAGLSGGAAALPGPPVVLLWLGGQGNAATVRANLIVFFGFTATAAGVSYWWGGLFTIARKVFINNELQVQTKFGCNGQPAQASYALPANATDLASAQTLVNAIKQALINNGIGS